jgi:exopolyphosphatase/guanosine-5'-triphosphate,3'-diphosphate pyrophosphatase
LKADELAADERWAALDLGSNSFHLLLARRAGASFVVEERLKEKVQLLAGFTDGCIHHQAQQRGLECLARFAQRLSPLDRERIWVKGTYALREADNAAEFVAAAESLLQVPVEIITGELEAHLIYGAVAHQFGRDISPRLVIDIGGGSTELACGRGYESEATLSVPIGCVAFKDLHFPPTIMQSTGYPAAKRMAVTALQQGLQSSAGLHGFDLLNATVIGTSGTVQSIQMVLSANGWARNDITRQAMAQLESAIVEDRWVIEAGLPGLAPDRADIFPAGVAILSACFEVLGIQQLTHVDVSLLQGIICEHVVDNVEADLREDSIAQLVQRFAVDVNQAARVVRCAERFYAQCDTWFEGDPMSADLLRWAATLHELGVQVSSRHYHRHGAYIIKHTELPGFNDHQQSVLSLLVRGHRRSMPGLAFQTFDPQLAQTLLRLVGLLRLAVILERSHSDKESPQAQISVSADELHLECGSGWLDAHPLSKRELEVEQQQQAGAGITLHVS